MSCNAQVTTDGYNGQSLSSVASQEIGQNKILCLICMKISKEKI